MAHRRYDFTKRHEIINNPHNYKEYDICFYGYSVHILTLIAMKGKSMTWIHRDANTEVFTVPWWDMDAIKHRLSTYAHAWLTDHDGNVTASITYSNTPLSQLPVYMQKHIWRAMEPVIRNTVRDMADNRSETRRNLETKAAIRYMAANRDAVKSEILHYIRHMGDSQLEQFYHEQARCI